MDNIWDIIVVHAISPAVCLLLTAFLTMAAIKVLPKLKLIDIPGGRHQHERTVPKGGGIAIAAGFFIVLAVMWVYLYFTCDRDISELQNFLRYFSLPAAVLLITGLLDDRYELSSIVKLIAQVAVGALLYFEGCGIEILFTYKLPSIIAFGLTVLWCVGIINAFNLIDGLDGVAAGLAFISAFLLAGWTIICGGWLITAGILLIFCSSCLGFLKFNFSPARIFLGDTGSMFIGLFFAYFSMQYSSKAVTVTALMVPLAAVGVPVFDVFLAIWRRALRKYICKDENSKIMQGDHDHLHHRILKETGKTGKTALIIYGLAITASLLAMINEFFHASLPTLVFIIVLMALATALRYSNIELYETLTSIAKGLSKPRRMIAVIAIHPIIDTMLIITALGITEYFYGDLLPFDLNTWDFLPLVFPFIITLCVSGIYRTCWLRVGIMQYFKLLQLLFFAGISGYIINIFFWYYSQGMNSGFVVPASAYYLALWGLSSCLIILERFTIRYYESFGYRKLFIRNICENRELPRVLVYGGGLSCRMYISSIYCSFASTGKTVKIAGIMDDHPGLKNLNVYGFKVLGGVNEIAGIYSKCPFDQVVIACENITAENIEKLKLFCAEKQLKIKKFECTERDL